MKQSQISQTMKIFTTKKIVNGEKKEREKLSTKKPKNASRNNENSPTYIANMKMRSSQKDGMIMMT